MKKILLALTLLLASCANKSANPKVRIANAGPGLQMYCLPITFAQTLGYYQDEGLDVDLETLPSVAKTAQALVGGSVDVAGISFAQTIQLAAEGQRVRSIFIINRRDNKVLFVAPHANNRIHRVEDLKGAPVGVSTSGSSTSLFANFYLAAHGIPPSDFQTIGIGLGASAIAAIENGRVDAAVSASGDHFRLLQRHPDLRILADSSTQEGQREIYGGDNFASGAMAAKQTWLDANPDAARRLARALLRTHQWIATHSPEEIRAKLPADLRSDDAAIDFQILRWGTAAYNPDGRMPPGAPETIKRYLDATIENVRHAKIDLASTWTNDFLPQAK